MAAISKNPLIQDRTVEFLLYEVLKVEQLCKLPYFADHSRETFDLFLGACRKFAREEVFASYKPMDEQPAYYQDGRVITHPLMRTLYPQLMELGVLHPGGSYELDGQQVPGVVAAAALSYLTAANLSALAFVGLTHGAAHLIESFGTDELKEKYMKPMYAGRWTGTMALTEPQAGSGLGDVQTKATPTPEGHYLLQGSKVFISGGDNDFSENIVHLALGRIEGAPAGTKGISLFLVPKLRVENDALVDNDVSCAGTFHKLGYRGIPSIALNFGENGKCRGYLVGQPHQGLRYMFQMMNSARIGVGATATATAMVAYEESLEYAKNRPQGRRFDQKPTDAPCMIIDHADVRRMLLRQKAITEGALALVLATASYNDQAQYGEDEEQKKHAQAMLDLLTPMTKTFPSEQGYESNVLAVQVLGGYGYTSEYLPESWLRDQKLNSIHEGTTGIQSLDLLGRKVMGTGLQSLATFGKEIASACEGAQRAGVPTAWIDGLRGAFDTLVSISAVLGQSAMKDSQVAMQNSVDYLHMFGTVVIAWQWLLQAAAAKRGGAADPASADFYAGKLRAAQYWLANELPRVRMLGEIIRAADDSFLTMKPEWF